MKKLLLLLLCAPIIVLGQQTINGTIMHDSLQREYILYVPASYDASTAAPLVFCFHGYGSSAVLNMAYTNFTGIADTAGFILIHPQGTIDNTGKAHWNVGGWTLGSTIDDIGFTSTLLDSIVNTYNIDTARVYSTGMSNGGYMSFLLACQLSDKIAAIASVTGSMTPQTYNACNPQHPTAVLQIHGDADLTVPYTGAPSWTKSIDEVLQYWVAYNNCDISPSTTAIPDINMSDNSTVEHMIYSGGDNGTTTEHFKVFGGGHDWPGAWGNMDIKASVEVWKFFSKYDIHGFTGSMELTSVNDAEYRIYPNPSNAQILIKGNFSRPLDYKLFSILGESIASGRLDINSRQIDLSDLPPNIYFLKVGSSTYKVLKIE